MISSFYIVKIIRVISRSRNFSSYTIIDFFIIVIKSHRRNGPALLFNPSLEFITTIYKKKVINSFIAHKLMYSFVRKKLLILWWSDLWNWWKIIACFKECRTTILFTKWQAAFQLLRPFDNPINQWFYSIFVNIKSC